MDRWSAEDRARVEALCALHRQILSTSEQLLAILAQAARGSGGSEDVRGYTMAAGPGGRAAPERATAMAQLDGDIQELRHWTTRLELLQAMVNERS